MNSRSFSVVGGEVGDDGQRVGVHFRVHVFFDKLPGLFDCRPLVSRVPKRPGDVRGDAQHVRVVAVGGAFVDEVGVGLPASIGLLLAGKPLLRSRDQFRVHVVDLRHVGELHQSVGGQNLVGRSAAEPGEAAAGNFKSQQPLIAVGDESLSFGVHFGSQLLGALHVIERQHVGVSARGGLLEAAARHAQNAVHAFDDLAQRTGIEPDENLAGVGDGVRREVDFVLHRVFQAAVEDQILLAAVGNDFDFAHHDVGAIGPAFHARRERELEFPDALGFERELRAANAAMNPP